MKFIHLTLLLIFVPSSYSKEGFKFPSYEQTIQSTNNVSQSDCISKCVSLHACLSVVTSNEDCHLYGFVESSSHSLEASNGSEYFERHEIKKEGFKFPFFEETIRSMKTVSPSDCLSKCVSLQACLSVVTTNGDCHLYGFVESSSHRLVKSNGSQYLERQEIIQGVDNGGSCKFLPCGIGEVCETVSGCGCAQCTTDDYVVYSDCKAYR